MGRVGSSLVLGYPIHVVHDIGGSTFVSVDFTTFKAWDSASSVPHDPVSDRIWTELSPISCWFSDVLQRSRLIRAAYFIVFRS